MTDRLREAIRAMPEEVRRKQAWWATGDQVEAAKRFLGYVERGVRELSAFELNWMTYRLSGFLDGMDGMEAVQREIEREQRARGIACARRGKR
jgi:hypothetical protein